jgi:transposase
MVIDGILFRTRAGCPWRDLPGEYGNWKTAYRGTVDVAAIRIWLRDCVT